MFKFGRYRIAFGRVIFFQTQMPTTVRRFLFFWVFKEARPDDVDSKQNFPILTGMELDGRKYRYCKAGEAHRGKQICSEVVNDTMQELGKKPKET